MSDDLDLSVDERIERLERVCASLASRCDELTAENAELRADRVGGARAASATVAVDGPVAVEAKPARTRSLDRRHLLRGGAAAVGAAVAGAVLVEGSPAAATDGSALLIGNSSQTGTNTTKLTVSSSSTSPAVWVDRSGGQGTAIQATNTIGGGVGGQSTSNIGVAGASGTGSGVRGTSASGYGVEGSGNTSYAVYGESVNSHGVVGKSDVHTGDPGAPGRGVWGTCDDGSGVYGSSTSGTGVSGTSVVGPGVYGTSETVAGVSGFSTSYRGVYGNSTDGTGVYGNSTNSVGVLGVSSSNAGLEGVSTSSVGVYAYSSGAGGLIATGAHYDFLLPVVDGRHAPATDPFPHDAGEFLADENGDVWACTVGGSTSAAFKFRKVSGPGTAGQLHLLPAPVRVYDSRPGTAPSTGPKTPLVGNTARVLDLKNNSSGVPAGATGALVTILLLNTLASNGNFTLWANGLPRPSGNTMVWGSTTVGRYTAKELTALDANGLVQVFSSHKTDIALDVVGYYR